MFNRHNISYALRAIAIVCVMDLVLFLLGTVLFSDNATIGWLGTAAFCLVYVGLGYANGHSTTTLALKKARLLRNQAAREAERKGVPVPEPTQEIAILESTASPRVQALLIAAPALLIALLSTITLDANSLLRILSLFMTAPVMRLYDLGLGLWGSIALYWGFALVYPAAYLVGSLVAPVTLQNEQKLMRDAVEAHKNGTYKAPKRAKKRKKNIIW